MCGLCGVLGAEDHWTDAAGKAQVFGGAGEHTRVRERAQRIALTNRVLRFYGLQLTDWGGHSYVLRNMTGQSSIVTALPQLWNEAEKLAHRRCDPLASDLVAALSKA
jgi:hypothetical protein